MERIEVISTEINKPIEDIVELINDNMISFELRNGSFLVDRKEVSDFMSGKETNISIKKLPKIVRKCLIETYNDFTSNGKQLSGLLGDVKKITKQIKKGRKTIHISETHTLLSYFKQNGEYFSQTVSLDSNRLEYDTTTYYEDLHQFYFSKLKNPFHTDKDVENSISCEHFIITHFILTNFNIII